MILVSSRDIGREVVVTDEDGVERQGRVAWFTPEFVFVRFRGYSGHDTGEPVEREQIRWKEQ